MAGLNFADIFETVVDTTPDAPALVVRSADGDDVRLSFAELDARANRLAHALTSAGVGPGDHVGCHLYDGNQYVEVNLAAFKIRAVPINVNFRYVDEELEYLFDTADLRLLVTEPDLEARGRAGGQGFGPGVSRGGRRRALRGAAGRPPRQPARRPRARARRPVRTVDGRDDGHAQGRDVATRGHLSLGGGWRREPRARGRPGGDPRRRGRPRGGRTTRCPGH